ncbi:MAG TPA: MFS transporter, partial [Agriterribacter sp.]|nr:MFS transporter [Agriterribacter sp.]
RLKSEGRASVNPLKESFGHTTNLKMVLLALFGATMGQGMVWYTGQFYAQSFIETVCKIDFEQSRTMLIWAIVFATPFFVVFGSWSDKIGRKWIMMTGMFLAIIFYRPIYQQFLDLSDTTTYQSQTPASVSEPLMHTDEINGQLITTTRIVKTFADGFAYTQKSTKAAVAGLSEPVSVTDPVYIEKRLPVTVYWKFVFLIFVQVIFVTMVYGPIAAFLVEMFPTRIRYTSMSLPYHIGNGVFGGLTPFIALLLTTINTGDKLVGLTYPIVVSFLCLIIGTVYISNRVDPDVND